MLTRDKGRIITRFLQRCQLQESQTEFLKGCKKPYDGAFLLLIFLPEHVNQFYLVHMSEQQSRRYWNVRRDYIPASATTLTRDDVNSVKKEVKHFLQQEHRGNFCQEQVFDFDGKSYVFLFADDQPTVERTYDESGNLGDLQFTPVFQIAIAYDSERGEVSVCCENATTRLNVHQAFAKIKFGQEEIPDFPEDETAYDLDAALQHLIEHQRMELGLPSGTAVEDIFITAVKFGVNSLGKLAILLDTKTLHREKNSEQPDAMYVAISSFFKTERVSANAIPLSDARPISLECIAYYRDPYEVGRIAPQKFTITGKNTCNLDLDGVHAEIRTCLEHNGIIKRKGSKAVENAMDLVEVMP